MSAPAATAHTAEAQEYLAAVGARLADLPDDERTALLEDLALHLDALSAEDDDRPLPVRLGPPETYAAELRAAAGLPPLQTAAAAEDGLQRRVAAVLGHRWVVEVRRLVAELRPAWWVVRGWLVVLVPCLVPVNRERDFPVPAPLGSDELGAVLVVAAVVGSVALGRRSLPRPARTLVAVAGALLALTAVLLVHGKGERQAALAQGLGPSMPTEGGTDRAVGRWPLLSRSGPVTDVLPYAADGTPLTGVLLFDQDGRPLRVGEQLWWADGCLRQPTHPLAADGVPVGFSYPQGYVLRTGDLDGSDLPAGAGQCAAELPRPAVPLPVFSDAAQPVAGG